MKCDFCSAPAGTRFSYPAHDFEASVTVHGRSVIVGRSIGGAWYACDRCHTLIERGDRSALARRSIEEIPLPADRFPYVRALHEAFFEARTGPAQELV